MALKLFKGELPKGAGGRKPRELDEELRDALLKALTDEPLSANGRPTIVGDTSRSFDSEGKASSDGRLYARYIAEQLDKTVRVRTIGTDGPNDTVVAPFSWVVYIPATESDTPTTEASGE